MTRVFALVGALALTALLSACVIGSTTPLLSDAESVAPLPAHAVLFGYEESPEGYTLSTDAPNVLDLDGTVYRSADGELVVRFVPVAGTDDTYVLAATGDDDSTIYGLARYAAPLLDLQVVLGDDAKAVLDAAAIADLAFSPEGTMATTRAAVDSAMALIHDGKLKAGSIVYFIAETADAAPPATLVREDGALKAGS